MSKPRAQATQQVLDQCLDRRGFLKSGVLAGAGAAVLTGAATGLKAAPPTSDEHTSIPIRPFGKTGWKLPVLAMGGSAMVKQFISAYGVKLLSTDERVAMVRHAYDRGIRYFDTARVYGESESIIGKALKDVRQNIFLATKIYVTNPANTRKCLETSLKELGTDHVETAQIHSPVIEGMGFKGAMKVHKELLKLRDEKMVRYIGLTTHVAFDSVHRMISTGGFDQCLLAYGYFRKGMDTLLSNQNVELRELCLAKAHELGMGIVAMKVMGASVFGHNSKNVVANYDGEARSQLPGAAIRWVLQDPRISLLNIGVSMPSDVDANIAVLSGDQRFTDADRRLLADFSRRAYESSEFKTMRIV
ncbi:MAG TPA: aldo/keto reductase [Planctomycetaceae bacterium]|jgi:predicted aldo/keto reductase-like oxidoreductase|nr:aldo/keto reductase [Planctomycetaceae bacterium]